MREAKTKKGDQQKILGGIGRRKENNIVKKAYKSFLQLTYLIRKMQNRDSNVGKRPSLNFRIGD